MSGGEGVGRDVPLEEGLTRAKLRGVHASATVHALDRHLMMQELMIHHGLDEEARDPVGVEGAMNPDQAILAHVGAELNAAAAAARSERFENWIVRELYTVRERGNPDASDSTSTWSIRLDADSINQWLAERLPTWAANQGFKLPTWLKHPMVVMKHDRLIVAARVKRNGTSQIVSLVYRPVQPQTGPVVLALVEIRSGTLGLPAGWLMDAVLERVEPKQREKWRTQLQHIPLRLKLSDKRYVTVERMTVEDGSVTLRCRTTRK